MLSIIISLLEKHTHPILVATVSDVILKEENLRVILRWLHINSNQIKILSVWDNLYQFLLLLCLIKQSNAKFTLWWLKNWIVQKKKKKLAEKNTSAVGYKGKRNIEKVSVKKKDSHWRIIFTFWRPLLKNADPGNCADKEYTISEH